MDQVLWWHEGLTPVGGGGRAPQGQRTTDLHPGTGAPPADCTHRRGERARQRRSRGAGSHGNKSMTGTKEQNDME